MKKMSRYREGKPITSIDELMKQDFIYFRHKLYHKGWFGSWQLRFAKKHIGEMFYAEKTKPDTIICKKCGRKFIDALQLKPLMKCWMVNGIYTFDFDIKRSGEPGMAVFRGCPECRTDEYLVNLEVDE